jgi:hypothetical protein
MGGNQQQTREEQVTVYSHWAPGFRLRATENACAIIGVRL